MFSKSSIKISMVSWLLLLFTSTSSFSQLIIRPVSASSSAKPVISKTLMAVCEIIVEDSVLLKDGISEFKLSLQDINSVYSTQKNVITTKIASAKNTVNIPLVTPIHYGVINYSSNSTREREYWNTHRLFPEPISFYAYPFEDGDEVKMHLFNKMDSVVFSGKSAAKFNCLYKIYKFRSPDSLETPFYKLYDAGKYEEALVAKKAQTDFNYAAWKRILNEYKNKMSAQVVTLIEADLLGLYNAKLVEGFRPGSGRISMFGPLVDPGKEASFGPCKDGMVKYFGNFKPNGFADSVLAKSYYYADFLLRREGTMLSLMKSTDQKMASYSFEDMYNSINESYDGLLRDKTMLLAIYSLGTRKTDTPAFLDRAAQNAGKNTFGNEIRAFRNNTLPGKDAFSFEYRDMDNKMHKLSDLKGKVVILDIWFTGCPGCLQMARALEPIIASYKSNPEVVFVSINFDRSRESWVKSMLEGTYTSKDAINLWTGDGLSDQTPMLKHYNIKGVPQLVVISKEGKLVALAAPDPRKDAEVFTKFIDKQL